MLLTNRRHRLLHLFLAAMDVGLMLPFMLLAASQLRAAMLVNAAPVAEQLQQLLLLPPLLLLLIFWLLATLYRLGIDLVNRSTLKPPILQLVTFGLMIAILILSIRILLYPTASLANLGWLRNSLSALFEFTRGWRPEMLLILVNLFLVVRAVWATGRDLTFFQVGLSFRGGLLVSLVGNALLSRHPEWGLQTSIEFFWIFIGFSLAAVGVARIDEKSMVGEHSRGASLPWGRLALLVTATLFILTLASLFSTIYTPQAIASVLAIFTPIWNLFESIGSKLLFALALLLEPLMSWIIETLRDLMEGSSFFEPQPAQQPSEFETIEPQSVTTFGEVLQNFALVRYCFVAAICITVGTLLWFFLVKPYMHTVEDEDEETEVDPLSLDGNLLRQGMDRLRNWADLLRNYGISGQLLDAVTVENIYANLSRMAGRRGFPRRLDQSPDLYLPDLRAAFPGHNEALARMTNAYMRVHYGDRAVQADELAQIRVDYRQVIESTKDQK